MLQNLRFLVSYIYSITLSWNISTNTHTHTHIYIYIITNYMCEVLALYV